MEFMEFVLTLKAVLSGAMEAQPEAFLPGGAAPADGGDGPASACALLAADVAPLTSRFPENESEACLVACGFAFVQADAPDADDDDDDDAAPSVTQVVLSGYTGSHPVKMGTYLDSGRKVHDNILFQHSESSTHYLFVSSASGMWVLTNRDSNFDENLGYVRFNSSPEGMPCTPGQSWSGSKWEDHAELEAPVVHLPKPKAPPPPTELTFLDSDGDTSTIRLSSTEGGGSMSWSANGREYLAKMTKLNYDSSRGRLVAPEHSALKATLEEPAAGPERDALLMGLARMAKSAGDVELEGFPAVPEPAAEESLGPAELLDFNIYHYDGGEYSSSGYGPENMMSGAEGSRPFHCSKAGKNFNLILTRENSDSFTITHAHITVRRLPSIPYQDRRIVVSVS